MQFEIYDSALPAGQYEATFEGIQEIDSQWGTRLQWIFKVIKGSASGMLTSAFSGADRPSVRSNLGKYLAALEGEAARAGIVRDPNDYVGLPFIVTVAEGEQEGATKVVSFRPIKADSNETKQETSIAGVEVPF